MSKTHTTKSICVFCGATDGVAADYVQAATALATVLVERGHKIVYGGGRSGLMGIVADTALAAGGSVLGVMSEFLVDLEVAHTGLSKLEITPDISHRKRRMTELSDAFVALPGGLGTLEEISEVISGAQLGLHTKPSAFLNTNGYYDRLVDFVDHAVTTGFVRPQAREMIIIESDPNRLVDRLTQG